MTTTLTTPCAQCPWRKSNQGKKHFAGFYTKANLRRLWNQVRGGGKQQSCHLTDPAHPDHITAGAKEGAKAQECPGSIILIRRELAHMADKEGNISDESLKKYQATRKGGIPKKGLRYWLIQRISFASLPSIFGGHGPIPQVDDIGEAIGLPPELEPRTV